MHCRMIYPGLSKNQFENHPFSRNTGMYMPIKTFITLESQIVKLSCCGSHFFNVDAENNKIQMAYQISIGRFFMSGIKLHVYHHTGDISFQIVQF